MAKGNATQPAARRVRTKRSSSTQTHLSHHQRKCSICRHPERETIERMFLHWQSSSTIHLRFMLPDRSTIYDHAHATGLFAKRRRNLRFALENIIERADECKISAHGIVAAIKACASITASGEWIEPARRVIYTSTSAPTASVAASRRPPQRQVSHPFANPYANYDGRSAFWSASDQPDLTGDGWYTRDKRVWPDTDSPYSSSTPSTPARVTPSATPASSAPASTSSAPGKPPAPGATASASVTARATQPSSAPSQTTTTAANGPSHRPAATVSAPPATRPQPPESRTSNRYTAGLKIPATHTKQTSAPHSNRYK